MNKTTGKLLTLGGFGLTLLFSLVNLATYFLGIKFDLAWLGNIGNLSVIIAAIGFGICFLAEQNFIDLLVGGALGLNALFSMFSNFVLEMFDAILFSSLNGIVFIISIGAMIVWALRFRANYPLVAYGIIGVHILYILASFILPQYGIAVYSIGSLILSFICNASRTYGAYVDYCEG